MIQNLVVSEVFYDAPQRRLGLSCKGVCFVKDNYLEIRTGVNGLYVIRRYSNHGSCDALDSLSHDLNASVGTSVKLTDPCSPETRAKEFMHHRVDKRRLSRPSGSIQ